MSIAAAPNQEPPAYGQVEALQHQLKFVCYFHRPIHEDLGADLRLYPYGPPLEIYINDNSRCTQFLALETMAHQEA
jgi:hypothetical protein